MIGVDEPAGLKVKTRDSVRAALDTSLGKQARAKRFTIGTQSDDPSHWFQHELAGGADYSAVYAARPSDPPYRVGTWRRANPMLDALPWLRKRIAREAKAAATDPVAARAFRAYRLNLGTADHEVLPLVALDQWLAAESDQTTRSGPLIIALDLTTVGMAGAVGFWPETGRVEGFLGCCSDPPLMDRGNTAGVGDLYVRAQARGELVVCGSAGALDVRSFMMAALDRFGQPTAVVYDRHRRSELLHVLGHDWPPVHAHERATGEISQAEDIRWFQRLFADGDIRPVASLALRDSARWAMTSVDRLGNQRLIRMREGRGRDCLAASRPTIAPLAGGEAASRRLRRAERPAILTTEDVPLAACQWPRRD